MAWLTPRTWTTGEVVTASIMNQDIQRNLNAAAIGVSATKGNFVYALAPNNISPLNIGSIYTMLAVNSAGTAPNWAEAYYPLHVQTGDNEVVNTASETTIYTSSDIGGNLLGTTSGVKLVILLSYLNNTGLNRTLTLKLKIDSTVILTPINAGSHGTSTSRRIGWFDFYVLQAGAANSQQAWWNSRLISGLIPANNVSAADPYYEEATSAVDLSSGTHNIIVTVQHSVASASLSIIRRFAGLFLARNV